MMFMTAKVDIKKIAVAVAAVAAIVLVLILLLGGGGDRSATSTKVTRDSSFSASKSGPMRVIL